MEERVGAVPVVVPVKFSSLDSATAFLANCKQLRSFEGLWAGPNRSPEDRSKHRGLFKVKRAIIEVAKCDPQSIVIDKPRRKIYRDVNGTPVDVCHVSLSNSITWNASVEQPIRVRAAALLAEAPQSCRISETLLRTGPTWHASGTHLPRNAGWVHHRNHVSVGIPPLGEINRKANANGNAKRTSIFKEIV